jgi:hypothetical protein
LEERLQVAEMTINTIAGVADRSFRPRKLYDTDTLQPDMKAVREAVRIAQRASALPKNETELLMLSNKLFWEQSRSQKRGPRFEQ